MSDDPRQEETALVAAARAGDAEAFDQLVQQHQAAVFGYLRSRVMQFSDAEDLAQEVFLRLHLSWERFESGGSLRAWLLGIARNLLREHIRKNYRRHEVAWTELCLEYDEAAAAAEAEPSVYEDQIEQLPDCLAGLGNSARQAIELRYTGELCLSDIGQKLRRSEGAAKLLMFRARQAIKNCLQRKDQTACDE